MGSLASRVLAFEETGRTLTAPSRMGCRRGTPHPPSKPLVEGADEVVKRTPQAMLRPR